MARYLVTGGAGFIGCNLARFLLDKGHEVTVLDNFATGRRENLTGIAGQVTLLEGDIRDRDAVDSALADCEGVFHQAALGSVPRSVEDPTTTHDVNVNGTVTVLEAARSAGVRRVIFAASSSAYGDQPVSPKVETMPTLPKSPYAASKVACEAYLRGYAGVFGLETLSLRYFNVFGPYQDPNAAYAAVIPLFVQAVLTGQPATIHGDGLQSRDFCYIDNVCQANWQAMTAPAQVCDGRVLNIACNRATTIRQIFERICDLLGRRTEVQHTPPRPGDVKHSLADVTAAAEAIGYQPAVHTEDGLARAIDWYRENLGG